MEYKASLPPDTGTDTDADLANFLDCILKPQTTASRSESYPSSTEVTEKNVQSSYLDEADNEGTWKQKQEIDLPLTGKPVKLKDMFAIDPSLKKKYIASASKRTRQKRKMERNWLETRNQQLEEEQHLLWQRIENLRRELEVLEDVNGGSINVSRASLEAENLVLRQEVKRRRTIMQRVKQLIREVPTDTDNDKELLSISKLGVSSALSSILSACYSSAENEKKTWETIPYDYRLDQAMMNTKHFSSLKKVYVKCENLSSSMKDDELRKMSLRMDYIGIQQPESIISAAIWKFVARKDEFSMFRLFQAYSKDRSPVQLKINQLNLDFLSEKLSKQRSKRWSLQDGKKQIIMSSLTGQFLCGNNKPVQNVRQNNRASDMHLMISANGKERVNSLGFDYYGEQWEDNDSIQLPEECCKVPHQLDMSVVTTSMVTPNSFSKDLPAEFTSLLLSDKIDKYEIDSSFLNGMIVHNLKNKEDCCNLTIVMVIEIDPENVTLMFLAEHLTKFTLEELETNSKPTMQFSPLLAVLANGIDKAIDEIIEERKLPEATTST